MSNSFERHGIDHLSASSLNSWATAPALWAMERLLKKSAPVGAAAHRGTAVEAGVTEGLLDPAKPLADCQATAIRRFDSITALSGDPKRTKEREAIEPTVEIALAELRQYGIPDKVQTRIERTLQDIPIPLIGFLDFGFSQHGIIIDLKTSLRLSSTIATNHARQVAGYVAGTNFHGRVAYATPQRIGVYQLDNVDEHLNSLRQIALRLGRFLAISSDPHELAALLVPDVDHYYYNNPITRANAREVFGL